MTDVPVCPICTENMESNIASIIAKNGDNCDHKFHDACIQNWAKIDSTCPMCRKSFNYTVCNGVQTYHADIKQKNDDNDALLNGNLGGCQVCGS